MKYRKLDANGDYQFGHRDVDFYVNTPDAVAQAVKTRLLLAQGEWFLNTDDGTPYSDILGYGTGNRRDAAIRNRVLNTRGVKSIDAYSSNIDATRRFSVSLTINTIYGSTSLTQVF